MPAEPAAVAAYLAHRAEGAARMGTLRMATAAIAAAHRREGQVNPCADRAVRVVMGGLARQSAGAGDAVRQVRGLTAEAVAAIRGALNGRVDTHWRTARDMAIVSVMSDAGLRRSEAAALTWADVAREDDGSGRITVRRSKTDQLAAGAVVAITPQALADLDRFAALRPPASESAHVFGISDGQIARRIAAAAAAAGLDGDYRGHSGRVGMAQRMTRNGAPVAAVMRQGRWQSRADGRLVHPERGRRRGAALPLTRRVATFTTTARVQHLGQVTRRRRQGQIGTVRTDAGRGAPARSRATGRSVPRSPGGAARGGDRGRGGSAGEAGRGSARDAEH